MGRIYLKMLLVLQHGKRQTFSEHDNNFLRQLDDIRVENMWFQQNTQREKQDSFCTQGPKNTI